MLKILIFSFLFSYKVLGASEVCPSGVIIEQYHRELGQMAQENIIPVTLQKRWELAHKFKFPLGRIEYFKLNGISVSDIMLLRDLSEKNILAQRGLPLGRMTIRNTPVIIEGVVEAGGETKEVILSVEERKYWVELKSSEGVAAKVPGVGGYRSPPVKGIEFRGHIQWEDADPETRAWLNGPYAIGIPIRTGESGFLTRVDDKRFRHLGSSWKDEETGLVWSSGAGERMNQAEAIKFCKKLGGELPTREMFEALAKNNGHKVFADNNNRWWWSSSVHHVYSNYAWLFNGNNGYVDAYFGRSVSDSVRCVAR